MWPRVPKASKRKRTPRLKKRRKMWKVRRQKRLSAKVKHEAAAMRQVKEEQSSDQVQGPLDTIYWTFAPGIRLFNVCRAKTG
eukprot:1724847-Lingulodinium_polyedra.AAC.1